MKGKSAVSAPGHLQPATQAWYRGVVERWDLEEHHRMLLQAAGESWDRLQQARALLDHDGLTVETQQGVKGHPAIAVERDSRLAFARLIRELDLDLDPPAAADVRPPKLRSVR